MKNKFKTEQKLVPLVSIEPNKWNPNVQSDLIKNKLKKSIQEHGFTCPILVRSITDSEYEIIDGEHRYKACEEDIKEKKSQTFIFNLTEKEYTVVQLAIKMTGKSNLNEAFLLIIKEYLELRVPIEKFKDVFEKKLDKKVGDNNKENKKIMSDEIKNEETTEEETTETEEETTEEETTEEETKESDSEETETEETEESDKDSESDEEEKGEEAV